MAVLRFRFTFGVQQTTRCDDSSSIREPGKNGKQSSLPTRSGQGRAGSLASAAPDAQTGYSSLKHELTSLTGLWLLEGSTSRSSRCPSTGNTSQPLERHCRHNLPDRHQRPLIHYHLATSIKYPWCFCLKLLDSTNINDWTPATTARLACGAL